MKLTEGLFALSKQPVILNAPLTSTILTIPPLIPPFTQGGHGVGYPLYTRGHGVGYPLYANRTCPFIAHKTFFTHRQKPITEPPDYPGVFIIQKNRAIRQSTALSPCLKGLKFKCGHAPFKDLFGADAFGLEYKIPVLVYAYCDELAGEHPAG